MDHNISAVEFLRQAFPGIRLNEAVEMNTAGDISAYPAGVILCHEDCIESTFYVLLDGEVQVTKRVNERETRSLKTLHPGDFFGEMALIHNAPRAATVTALTEIRVLEIQKEDFRHLLEKSNMLSLTMVREVSRRLRENDKLAIEDLRVKAQELAAAYQQLAEQEYARSEFLTTIAHELRTPLTTASGFVQVIRSGMLSDDALDSALDTVYRNLQDIVSLVNDILFLQEMELIQPDFRPVDLTALVIQSVDSLASKVEAGSVRIVTELPPASVWTQGEPRSLERAVKAILDNAIKFSPNGGEVRVWLAPQDDMAQIAVSDNGIGIPADILPHIFDRFFHLDRAGDQLFRGSGLGLSIAQSVIEFHHGLIQVESKPGLGSTFRLFLPLATME